MGRNAAASGAMDAAEDAAQRLRLPAVKVRISWRQRRGDTLEKGETTEVNDGKLTSGHLKVHHWLRGVQEKALRWQPVGTNGSQASMKLAHWQPTGWHRFELKRRHELASDDLWRRWTVPQYTQVV